MHLEIIGVARSHKSHIASGVMRRGCETSPVFMHHITSHSSGSTVSFRRDERRGFTLVELLAVIACIGILAAILTPVIGKVRSSSRQAQCMSNLRQLYVMILSHAQDNKGVLIAGHDYKTNLNWQEEKSALSAYADGKSLQRLAVCPENESDVPLLPTDSYGHWVQDIYGYPYAYNYFVLTNASNAAPVRLGDLVKPGKIVMMVDSARDEPWGPGFSDASDAKWSRIGTPHAAKLNVMWCDGHVSSQQKSDIEQNVRIN